jgi:thiamine biosynthesis lipoprotein
MAADGTVFDGRPMVLRGFRAMGTDAHVIVIGGDADLAAWAEARIAGLEARWSRFLATSEVSALNEAAGRPLAVSWETALLVDRAIEAWRLTAGRVDATVLGDVVRAGYDADFARLPGPDGRDEAPRCSLRRAACSDITRVGDQVRLPAGVGFDPGGIGKGLAADLVVDELLELGAAGACVNLGGDLRVDGRSPDGDGWTVALAEPAADRAIVMVGLRAGAVATSTTARRRWTIAGQPHHHLIDPVTGRSSTTDLVQVSAIAADGWRAEVFAKAALLRGAADAFEVLPPGVEALAVDVDGRVTTTPGLDAFLGDQRVPEQVTVPVRFTGAGPRPDSNPIPPEVRS